MKNLPNEVMLEVFLQARVEDLLSLMNVSQRFRQLARTTKLWNGLEISGRRIRGRETPVNLDHVSPDDVAWLFCRVSKATLWNWANDCLASKILSNTIQERQEEVVLGKKERIVNLEELNMSSNNLSRLDRDLLANGVVKIKKVSLAETRLTSVQLNSLSEKIVTETQLILEDLNLRGVNLSRAKGPTLASAVVKIKKVVLTGQR